MELLKKNDFIREILNVNIWHPKNYTGKNIHVVIFDRKGSPLDFIENASAPFCSTFIHSHATNVVSIINQFSECKITMLYNSDECKKWFMKNADDIDIVNISMSANKELSEYNWGFLEQYNLPIFCSSGNESKDEIAYPSAFSWTISVGAYENNVVTNYSNYSIFGDKLDCVGFTGIYVLNSKMDSFQFSGTSCSSPLVASLVSIYAQFIKENYSRKLGRQETFDFIHNNCIDVEGNKDGYGLFTLPKEIPTIEKPINKYFRIQCGNFLIKANGINEQNRLKLLGLNTYLVQINGYWKIQLGAWSNESLARKESKRIKEILGINNFIVYY